MDFKRTVIPFEKSNLNQFKVYQKPSNLSHEKYIDRAYFEINCCQHLCLWEKIGGHFIGDEDIPIKQRNSFKFLNILITKLEKNAIKNLANDLFTCEGEKISLSDISKLIKQNKFTVLKSQYKFYRSGIFNLFFKDKNPEDLKEITSEKIFKDKNQLYFSDILSKISEKLMINNDNYDVVAEVKPEQNYMLMEKYNDLDLMKNVQKFEVLDQEIKNRILNDSLLEEVNKKEESEDEEKKEPINLLEENDLEKNYDSEKDLENIFNKTDLNIEEEISEKAININEIKSQISISTVLYLVDFQIPKNKMIIKNISSIQISYGKIVLLCDNCTFSGNLDIPLKRSRKCFVASNKCTFCSQTKEKSISQNSKSDKSFVYRKKAYILMSK